MSVKEFWWLSRVILWRCWICYYLGILGFSWFYTHIMSDSLHLLDSFASIPLHGFPESLLEADCHFFFHKNSKGHLLWGLLMSITVLRQHLLSNFVQNWEPVPKSFRKDNSLLLYLGSHLSVFNHWDKSLTHT